MTMGKDVEIHAVVDVARALTPGSSSSTAYRRGANAREMIIDETWHERVEQLDVVSASGRDVMLDTR